MLSDAVLQNSQRRLLHGMGSQSMTVTQNCWEEASSLDGEQSELQLKGPEYQQ